MSTEPFYDPEVKAILDGLPPFGTVAADNLDKIRAARITESGQVSLSDKVERSDHLVPGPDGGEVRLRVHRPVDAEGQRPVLYWMHGGGYVLGSPEQDDLRFDRWCQRFNIIGVAVQYRLAPENPYPGGLEDCYAGLAWVKENGETLGMDPSRVGIGGPSGGGGMAAALGLLVRDRGQFEINYQMLIYPMIDDTMTSPSSHWEVPIWDRESNHFGWSSYLGDLFGTDNIPTHAAPSRETDLSGLPPTYVMAGSLDGFVDEDIDYATRLNQAGVPTELHVYPGAPHGFEGFVPQAAVSKQARRDINDWLGRMVADR